jgi:two-component system sensor histidine kinase CpxA
MKARFPLYAKILLWLFANVVLFALLFYGLFRFQFNVEWDSLLAGRAGERIKALSEVLRSELNEVTPAEWNPVLQRFGQAYGVKLLILHPSGVQLAGEPMEVPPEVREKLQAGRRREAPVGEEASKGKPAFSPAPRGDFDPPRHRGHAPDEPKLNVREGWKFLAQTEPVFVAPAQPFSQMVHTQKPKGYWILVRYPVKEQGRSPRPFVLAVVSSSLNVGGLFSDFAVIIAVAGGAIAFSALFWLPLVRGITRSISQMTNATAQIAEGRFEVRVGEGRQDEIGALGREINQMAGRLAGLVNGQQRFLGDVAHELCSPLARTQMALGILEQKASAAQLPYLTDLREEVQMMSSLVNELLSFSKASLGTAHIQLSPVNLGIVALKAVAREGNGEADIRLDIPDHLQVLAEPEMLLRSVSNLVRNAIRYAGQAGPITLRAEVLSPDQVTLSVIDLGPGIPAEERHRVFDPFYRADPSRTRETGGVGLGLAIVKTCVEACGGTVTCKNLEPSGFSVFITLKAAHGEA